MATFALQRGKDKKTISNQHERAAWKSLAPMLLWSGWDFTSAAGRGDFSFFYGNLPFTMNGAAVNWRSWMLPSNKKTGRAQVFTGLLALDWRLFLFGWAVPVALTLWINGHNNEEK